MKKIFSFIILVSTILYLLTVKGVLGNFTDAQSIADQRKIPTEFVFDAPHTISSYVLMLSILNNNSVKLTKDYADLAVPDVGYYKGDFYSFFPPGVALTIIPMYLLGSTINMGILFTNITIVFFAILSILLLYKICREIISFSIIHSLLVIFIYAFCSTAWPYAISIFQHQITTFFLLLMLYSLFREKKAEKKIFWQILIFGTYGMAIIFDYPNVLLLLPFILYIIIDKIGKNELSKKFVLVHGIILLIFFSLNIFYNKAIYGNYTQISNALPMYTGDNLKFLTTHNEKLARLKPAQDAFHPAAIPDGIHSLFLHSKNSFFVFTPIFLFAFYGIQTFFRQKKPFFWFILFETLWFIFVYSTFVGGAGGGWSFGPRYLIPIIPFISIFTIMAFLNIKKNSLKYIFYGLLLYSMANTLSSTLTTRSINKSSENILYGIKNFDMIMQGASSSFFYNVVLRNKISLLSYFFILYLLLVFILLYITRQLKSSSAINKIP